MKQHTILFLLVVLTAVVIAGCRRGEAFDPSPSSPGNSTYNDNSAAGTTGPEKILGDEITR